MQDLNQQLEDSSVGDINGALVGEGSHYNGIDVLLWLSDGNDKVIAPSPLID